MKPSSKQLKVSEFLLKNVFNKIICKDGDIIYWRDCILSDNMQHGEQGYMIYYPNEEMCHHTYHYPPNWIK